MKISVITAVNRPDEYKRNVLDTLQGVDEFIPVENAVSQSAALNTGMDRARNDICVLCHQDVRFPRSWMDYLTLPNEFGVCGVWGVDMAGYDAGHVIEPRGHWRAGRLPSKAQSVDELLMIVKNSSGLRFDEGIAGWHLSGADLCLQAHSREMDIFIIDDCVVHLSTGCINDEFMKWKNYIETKWKGKSPLMRYRTPNTWMDLS